MSHIRFMHRAKAKLTKKNGRWWSGNEDMKLSQQYTFTFASAAANLQSTMFCLCNPWTGNSVMSMAHASFHSGL